MTRPFNQMFDCPSCGNRHTLETDFGRWIRNNPLLDSGKGFSVHDQDYWIHRFKTHEGRAFQLLMMVEIKTHGADVTEAQRDTLHAVNQVLRNRRQTPTKRLKWQAGNAPLSVYSSMMRRNTMLRVYGMHVLRFSGNGPTDSESIRWNGKLVDEETLTSLLRFDLDPDTLQPLDLRRHHRTMKVMPLFS